MPEVGAEEARNEVVSNERARAGKRILRVNVVAFTFNKGRRRGKATKISGLCTRCGIEADEGLGIAAGTKGADGVDNLLRGDALAAEAEENDGGEEAARDQGGKEGQEDEEDDEGVDLQTEKMIEQGNVHTGNARRVCLVGEPTRQELVDAKSQLPRETVGFVFEKIGRKRANEVAG